MASTFLGRIAFTPTILLAGSLFAVAGVLVVAGPLGPPVGPVAPTFKTLTEVEPRIAINPTNTPGDADSLFKITAPGSYYLAGNVTGVVGKHGIEIVASGVTLDLNGFDLVGVPAMGAFDGVSVTVGSLTNIAVIHGSVRNWGRDGVDLRTSNAANCRIDGVLAGGNAGDGIRTSTGCMISNCSASSNGSNGFLTSSGCTVLNCLATFNTVFGIDTSIGCTVSNCSATSNTGSGIVTNIGCSVTNCLAFSNGGNGISASSGNTVTNCSASGNAGSGIYVFSGTTVADCTARSNILDGVQCGSACVIRGNTCSENGIGNGGVGAGVRATGADNRIEGNNCSAADYGIRVDSLVNLVFGNSCRANTSANYSIVAGNTVGVIIIPPASGAINGNSGAGGMGTTDPWANIAF
jgi:parallel beta-helix repeat protein